MKRFLLGLCVLLCAHSAYAQCGKVPAQGESIAGLLGATAFIDEMVARHQFDRADLSQLLAQTCMKQSILNAMSRPAEAKPWSAYRPLFVEPKHIAQGVRFWAAHDAALARAEAEYGVPASMIVAIIGVETFYGRNTGSFRVMDALATLAFGYPQRAAYFRDELEQYLLLAREAGFAPLSIKGSYAGAMGIGQFMPSSYRNFGVDFDGDGQRDLWDNPDDAIGSVANYFHGKGWVLGAPVVTQATAVAEPGKGLANHGWSFRMPLKYWARVGVAANDATHAEAEAMLLELAGANGPEHWLAYENFYVITRYNHSFHYAMAVWQLSQELEAARAASIVPQTTP
jgi:membrane-bound lytic murein transglycosylase B